MIWYVEDMHRAAYLRHVYIRYRLHGADARGAAVKEPKVITQIPYEMVSADRDRRPPTMGSQQRRGATT